MRKLYILRHAKSSWDDPSYSDFDRPLNDRGLRTAPFMGRLMAERGIVPELTLCSPAKRAAETAALLREAAPLTTPIRHDRRIYEASPMTLLDLIGEVDEETGSVMIVGHNPGLEGLVRFLTGELHPMPTAALAGILMDVTGWNELPPGGGRLEFLIRPKDEMKFNGEV